MDTSSPARCNCESEETRKGAAPQARDLVLAQAEDGPAEAGEACTRRRADLGSRQQERDADPQAGGLPLAYSDVSGAREPEGRGVAARRRPGRQRGGPQAAPI